MRSDDLKRPLDFLDPPGATPNLLRNVPVVLVVSNFKGKCREFEEQRGLAETSKGARDMHE